MSKTSPVEMSMLPSSHGWDSLYQGCGKSFTGTTDDVREKLLEFQRSGEWIAEPKYDGIWVAVYSTDADGATWVASRTGKLKLNHGLCPIPTGCILIGELTYGSQHSATRREELGHGRIDVFDCLYHYGKYVGNAARDIRKSLAAAIVRSIRSKTFMMAPTYTKAYNWPALYDASHEGLVIKPIFGEPYVGGTRSKKWIKFKKKNTFDVIILDWKLSKAETKQDVPMAATLIVGLYVYGGDKTKCYTVRGLPTCVGISSLQRVSKVSGMTHEVCRDVAANFKEKYLGRVAEISAFQQFKSGAFRHPGFIRLRDDKKPEECVFRG